MKIKIRINNILFKGSLPDIKTSKGAPIATPRAYADIKCPAFGMLIDISRAISGSMPIMPNSDIPNPKVPKANAMVDFFIFFNCLFTKQNYRKLFLIPQFPAKKYLSYI